MREEKTMLEITALNNERMRAALELLEAKAKRAQRETPAEIITISGTDIEEVLLVAGMNEKEIEII